MNPLLGWLAVVPSFAADGYLECREFGERSEAVAASRAARDGGLDARVVRRFESDGWRYLVVVEAVSDPQAAATDRGHFLPNRYRLNVGNSPPLATGRADLTRALYGLP